MTCSLLNERSLGQSSGVTWWGGGRRKSNDWLIGSSCQKDHHWLEKFEEKISVWIKPVSEADCWGQPAPGRSLTRKKERKKSEHWKPVKNKYNWNCFPSTILKYWKVICIQKKETVKGSISPIIEFIEWTLQQASVRRLRPFYSSKRKGKKEKRERRRKKDCWETFLFDVFL